MGVLGENLLALPPLPETLDSDEKINTDSVDATADVPKALKPHPPPLVLENGLTHSGTSTGTDRDCSGGEEESLMLGISNCDQTPEAKRLCLNNQGAAEEINRFCLIPEHVVEQILLSLDADSLRDCKHVCKTWFHLISDPSFINKHLDLVCNRKNAKMISIIGYNIFSTVTVCEGDDGNTVDNDDYFCCVIEQVKTPLKV
ncbi:uncharacterized protein LOC133804110 [Humulus lupulus]|uniref:uncharacterized protein LOC133804110 n=1 Tax=Humulus lupulus TaxID=3486 RepID=UPI002B40CE8F|nr:uncharacterized protein LOC133804110 [Humulus lupulus]